MPMKKYSMAIDDKDISELVSRDSKVEQGHQWSKNNHQYFSEKDNNSIQYDYEAYIRRLSDLVVKRGLEENVEIERLSEPEIIEENNFRYLVKYRIIVQSLEIKCRNAQLIFEELGIDESIIEGSTLVSDKFIGGISICFVNILFTPAIPNKNSYIRVLVGNNCRIQFKNCCFDDVDLYFAVKGEAAFAHFIGNTFNNRHITLWGASDWEIDQGYKSGNYRVKPDNQAKIYAARRLSRFIHDKAIENNPKAKLAKDIEDKVAKGEIVNLSELAALEIDRKSRIEIKPDDVEYTIDTSVIISLRDNDIAKLNFGGKSYYLIGKNRISKISTDSSPEHVYYGPYNELDSSGANARLHKPVIAAWKEHALKSKDKSQEIILNRELMKLERHILKYERGAKCFLLDPSTKDRFILWFSAFSSDYGTNWVRSAFLILLLNLAFSVLLFSCLGYSLDLSPSSIFNTVGWYFELIIPTKSVSSVIGNADLNTGWEAVNIIKNIFASAFLYQMIVSFRKYSGK